MNKEFISLLLRGILSSIAILIVSYFIMYVSRLTWLPHIMSTCIIISILITAFLIKTNSLSQSIWLGVGVGTLTGILYFSYYYFIFVSGGVESKAGDSPEVVLGFLIIFSFIFTAMWIISSMIGAVISYFVRKKMFMNKLSKVDRAS